MSRPILAEYVRAGFVLVPIPAGEKGPVVKGWNDRERCVTDPETAEYLDGNVGLAHAYSGTVCLDIDDFEKAQTWFAEQGVALLSLIDASDSVLISSGREGRAKLLYKHAEVLPTFKLNQFGFELRCASSNGLTMQDVLPPSVHPDTGREYTWLGDWRNLPEIPETLLTIWRSMIKPDNKIPREAGDERPATSLKQLSKLVAKQDADASYDDWIKVGMMLHYETQGSEEGFDLWDRWSQGGSKYKGTADLETHWRSFRVDSDNPVTADSFRIHDAASIDEFAVVTQEHVDRTSVTTGAAGGAVARPMSDSLAQLVASLERDKSGGVYATLPNLMTMLAEPEACQWRIRLDEFKSELMFAPVTDSAAWRPIKDTDYTAARIWLEENARFHPVSKDMIRDTMHYVGEQNKMDSAQEWLTSLRWDGIKRIDTFMPKYMGTVNTSYERSVGVYLWTALAGRVMQPGCQVDMAPILVGRQGIGKSQGIKALVPDPSFYVEIRLDEEDDAIARKIRGVLVGEIAELRGLRTSDRDRIKAFMTRTHEKWTPKYMEHSTTFARRLVMFGSTNDDEFLDDTENRRWLPVRTTGVDVKAIERDREQLWAEAYERWLAEGILWQEAEKLGKESRADFETEDNWQRPITEWLELNKDMTSFSTADVLTQAIGYDHRQVNRQHELRVSRILPTLGYKKVNKRFGNKVLKVWTLAQDAVDLLA